MCRRTAISFPRSRVRQNLLLGMKARKQKGRWSMDDMYKLFPVLRERADAPAGVISGGEQQMLTLCRTLMGDPELVMIDEPTEGLAPMIVELVARLVPGDQESRRVDPAGRAKAHHRAQDLAAPLRHGPRQIVFEGTPEELRANEAVRKEWLEV